jgi:myosin-5
VSQQAIAQQEKMDYDGDDIDDEHGPNGTNGDGMGMSHEHNTIQEEIAA